MTDFEAIFQNKPGLCQMVFVFCCSECLKISFSFAKTRPQAYTDAYREGWVISNNLWACPNCKPYIISELGHKKKGKG